MLGFAGDEILTRLLTLRVSADWHQMRIRLGMRRSDEKGFAQSGTERSDLQRRPGIFSIAVSISDSGAPFLLFSSHLWCYLIVVFLERRAPLV
jgi:hypothetical protein